MLDRTCPPCFQEIGNIPLPWPETHVLENQLPLHALNLGIHPMVEIELVCQSGAISESLSGAAAFTASMLLEGTKRQTAQEIARRMDHYGASIKAVAQADFSVVTLSTLSKHLAPVLALFLEIALEPRFSAKALQLQQAQKTQAIQIADKKAKKLAYKRFHEALFGTHHPYGKRLTAEAVAAIRTQDLHCHYETHFFAGCTAFVSGQFTDADLRLIQQTLSQLPTHQIPQKKFPLPPCGAAQKHAVTAQGKGWQSAVLVGKRLLKKKDEDFLSMLVVNELLGGYFGSRLMRNLREEKGYTYGIHSTLVALQEAGYWVVSTEVGQAATEATVREIYKEIQRMQEELVEAHELKIVQNHLLGRFLASIGDPFSIMHKFQSAHLHGLGREFYAAWYDRIRHTTAAEIRDLAGKYLALETLTEVVAS